MNQVNKILTEVLERVSPKKEELKIIYNLADDFSKKFDRQAKRLKIKCKSFVGGSFAKKTMIKKAKYDVDIFIRFDAEYKDKNLSELCEKILKHFCKAEKIHGSRNYFKISAGTKTYLEIIPVIKISNPKQAENITDLSYSHVEYVKKKIKNNLLDDIKLAKAFCYANQCYGAESYIHGFSGYSLELMIYYYGSFLKFVRAIAKNKTGEKIIIDIEKHYKNKQLILMEINSSKLQSPVVLIDPTFKQRNAAAALSQETFEKFKKTCQNFLKSPSEKYFEIKKIDLEKTKKDAEKKKFEFILLEAKTDKQEGDIAGSKLLKFYNHLEKEIERYFEIKNKGFDYDNRQTANFFFVVKSKKEILIQGPFEKDLENVKKFKKEHRRCFIKKGKVYAKEKIDFSVGKFIEKWKLKNKNRMESMSIQKLRSLLLAD